MKDIGLTRKLVNISLILIIILLFGVTFSYWQPLLQTIKFILVPLILAGYVFYALRPLKHLLMKVIKNETLCAAIVFVLFLIFLILLAWLLSTMFISQTREILTRFNVENLYNQYADYFESIDRDGPLGTYISELLEKFRNYITGALTEFMSFVGSASRFGTQLLLMILSIFYLLKDEYQIKDNIIKLSSGNNNSEVKDMFVKIHGILKTYISSQILVAIIEGTLMFLGYVVIGLPYALLLGLLSLIGNLIPFIGAFLSAIPAMLIGLSINLSMMLKVLIVTILVQQIESNLITPNVVGQKLSVHPLIVIIVVLMSMRIFGVIGALIATPLYLTILTIVKTIIRIRKNHKNSVINDKLKHKES